MMSNNRIYLKGAGSPVGAIVLMDVPPGAKSTEPDIAHEHHQKRNPDKEKPVKTAAWFFPTCGSLLWCLGGCSARPGNLGRCINKMDVHVLISALFNVPISRWDTVISGNNGCNVRGDYIIIVVICIVLACAGGLLPCHFCPSSSRCGIRHSGMVGCALCCCLFFPWRKNRASFFMCGGGMPLLTILHRCILLSHACSLGESAPLAGTGADK